MNSTLFAMDQRDRAYKAVISLNNTGCSLMSRGMYTDAVDTFKDAIRLMRESFFNGGALPSACEFDQALQAAWIRSSNKTSVDTCQDNSHLQVLTDRESPYAVYGALERNGGILCCVIIEPVDSYDGHDTERIEAESALLLHNYGTSHVCAARTDGWDDVSRCKILETAFQIFELAQSVASKLYTCVDDEDASSPVLLVSLLVTVNLLQLAHGSEELRYQYSEDLVDLIEAISEQEMMLPQETGIPAAAA